MKKIIPKFFCHGRFFKAVCFYDIYTKGVSLIRHAYDFIVTDRIFTNKDFNETRRC